MDKFDFKPAAERTKATFAKRHDRVFCSGDQDKTTLREFLDQVVQKRAA